MKKLLAMLVAVMMLITSSAFAEDAFDVVPTDIAGEMTFYTYYADSQIVHVDNALAVMAAKYPNLKINIEHRADSDGTALKTWAAVGELPDFFEINGLDTHETLKANGDLYELTSALDKTGFYDLFNNGDLYRKYHSEEDGTSYALGITNSDVLVCYYNVALLNELGLTPPTNFEEFKHCITVLKDAGKIPVALFAAEQWPGMGVYELACISEGLFEAVDPINDGKVKFGDNEAYMNAAKKLQEIVDLGAFGIGALSTNASQAFELLASGEAGFLFNGSWHFATGETEGYGENLGWCRYNVFADAEDAEAVKMHAVGGKIPKQDYSVNANPKSGLDPETVACLALEFKHAVSCSEAAAGQRSLAKGDYTLEGSEHFQAFNVVMGQIESFTDMPYNLSNSQFASDFGNAVEMMVSGNFTAEDFIEEMTICGF